MKPKRVAGPYTEEEKQKAFERLINREIEKMRDEDYNAAVYQQLHENGWR